MGDRQSKHYEVLQNTGNSRRKFYKLLIYKNIIFDVAIKIRSKLLKNKTPGMPDRIPCSLVEVVRLDDHL